MKVFVINMRKDRQRRLDMQDQFNQQRLEVEFFEGIDGKKIDPIQFERISDKHKLEEKEKRPIEELTGMVGCTYSHYLVYQRMLKDNIEVACILEDDVILADNISQYLDFAENNIEQNEIISLHTLLYDAIELTPTNRRLGECEIMMPSPPKIRGTQGYVITQYCAAQLIKEMMPIQEFPDCFNRYHLFCEDVQIRVLFPFILRHMWIDSVRDDQQNSFKSRVMKLIQTYRIFPFWNLTRWRRRNLNDNHISSYITINSKRTLQLYVNSINKNRLLSRY